MSTEGVATSTEILNSWKEIAGYMNRGIRTVQRWEADLGMPVRRPRAKGRSAVLAMRGELDGWIKACPIEHRNADLSQIEPLRTSTLELRRLRTDLNLSRTQLSGAIANLVATLKKVAATTSAIPTQPPYAYACATGPGEGAAA
jgi:hypothetical protein